MPPYNKRTACGEAGGLAGRIAVKACLMVESVHQCLQSEILRENRQSRCLAINFDVTSQQS